jgi:probable F420-dependent oxidoreductase
VRFLFQYPETAGTARDMLEAGAVDEVAHAAEAAGWSGVAFTEHPAPSAKWLENGGHQTLDPFVALSYAAAATTRIRLFTYLSIAAYRNPNVLAKAAASLDRLSGGRLVLGLGTGYLKSELHALGVDLEERNRLFDETLDVLPLHWSGEAFVYTGSRFEARDVVGLPRPSQSPIPIWIGGNSRLTRHRVATRANGWMPLLGRPGIEAVTRTPAISSDADLGRMIAEMQSTASSRNAQLDVLYPLLDRTVDQASEAPRHREHFEHLAALGVTWITVSTNSASSDDTFRYLDQFGELYCS